MQVTVRFLGALRDQVGKQSEVVDLPPDATYRDLLDHIAPRMETCLAAWAWDAERRTFSRRMMALRNSSVQLRDDSSLSDGDEVVVLMPLAGG